jgi:hypothetical protein
MADPLAVPLSRLFIVCGRAVEVSRAGAGSLEGGAGVGPVRSLALPAAGSQEETLRGAFAEYGDVQHVKVIKDKGGEPPRRGSFRPACCTALEAVMPGSRPS